jgi:RimJ/RimL family protein N-acetyltransferase
MTDQHVEALWSAGSDPELWRFTSPKIATIDAMRRYVTAALAERDRGVAIPFCTVERQSGDVIGSTRFGNIVPEHKRVEIGWTFVTPRLQRSPVNTEAKYLMLRHAFETWGCNRVELKTNVLNEPSRNAMLRIGCTEEGVLRRHMVNDDGTVRDTVYYSIIAEEWPSVKQRLEQMLERTWP